MDMDPLDAEKEARYLERQVAAVRDRVTVACYPVPSRPGGTLRRVAWSFVVVTDAPRGTVQEVLAGFDVELQYTRGDRSVLVAWPRRGGVCPVPGVS